MSFSTSFEVKSSALFDATIYLFQISQQRSFVALFPALKRCLQAFDV
jgi:hypothetical protein